MMRGRTVLMEGMRCPTVARRGRLGARESKVSTTAMPRMPSKGRTGGQQGQQGEQGEPRETRQQALVRRRVVCSSSASGTVATASNTTPAPVEAVLFDMDGVLVTSDGISRLAARDVLEDLYGLRVDPDAFLAYTGMGEGVFLSGVARAHGVEIDVDRTKEAFFERYLGTYCDGSVDISFSGALELVKGCKEAGLKVGLASAADYVKVEGNLKAGRIDIGLFDAVVSADAFEGRLKPHPDIFLAASALLGVEAGKCVVIEDALAGVEAGKRAGMRVIGVSTTLDADVLRGGAYVPDMLRGDISEITVADILGCV